MKYELEGACTLVIRAGGTWKLSGSSHWSLRTQCCTLPHAKASTLDSRSYLGLESAELNIKTHTHKPELETIHTLQNESSIFPTVQLGKLSHREYVLFKVWWRVCDRTKSRIQFLPYHDLGSVAQVWWDTAEWAGVVYLGKKEVEVGPYWSLQLPKRRL